MRQLAVLAFPVKSYRRREQRYLQTVKPRVRRMCLGAQQNFTRLIAIDATSTTKAAAWLLTQAELGARRPLVTRAGGKPPRTPRPGGGPAKKGAPESDRVLLLRLIETPELN